MQDTMRLLKLLLVLFVCAGGPAVAGPFEDAIAAHDKGDFATALRLFRPLAEQGKSSALFNLGLMYRKGEGVPQDYAAAVSLYRKGAEQRDAVAQNNLGVMYAKGHGVPQDYVLAHMWFNLAAAQSYETAVKNRDLAVSNMTPAQIAEAQKLAREWKPKTGR